MVKTKITFIVPLEKTSPMEITSGKVRMPRFGPLALASQLDARGFDAIVFDENVSGKIDWQRVLSSDFVCISIMSFCASKGFAYIRNIRDNSAAKIIVGGMHASIMPDECLQHADWVVRNEGDETLLELLDCLMKEKPVMDVKGLSFNHADGRRVHNERREFIEKLDFRTRPELVSGYGRSSISQFAADISHALVPRLNILPVQAGRGCPYNCSFCYVRDELGTVYRMRDPDDVLADIEAGLKHLNTRCIFFVDNDLTLNREFTQTLFRKIADRFNGDLTIYFFARTASGQDRETMEIAKTAGDIHVAIGIESINDSTLVQLAKGQTRKEIIEGLAAFREQDINIQALTIFGGEEDTVDTIRETIDFYIENEVFNVGICCLYDFPCRTELSTTPRMWAENRFIHLDWRYYNGNFVIYYPKRMKPSTLQQEIINALRRFYSKQKGTIYQFHPSLATATEYIPFLKKVEKGLYNSDEELLEENLPEKPLTAPVDIKVGFPARFREAALFYGGNLFRPTAWKFLLNSLVSNKQ